MSPTDRLGLTVSIILALIIAIIGLVFFLRMMKKAGPKSVSGPVPFEAFACPRCAFPMEQGYAAAFRGVMWRRREQAGPGIFATIFEVLPNTLNTGLRPLENQAWYCPRCKLLLLDHNRLIAPDK